ncbi:MAG: hypothetical protein ABIG70_08050 [Pseudomonadota bacterium]
MMTFDDKYWDCGDALVNIFFSDWGELKKESALRKKVGDQLLRFLDRPIKRHPASVPAEHSDEFRRLVESIKGTPIPIGRKRFAPIVWIKMALQLSMTGIPIAKSFLRRYGKWRDENQQQEKLALVVPVKHDGELDDSIGLTSKTDDRLIGYALDVFLLTDIDDFQERAWRIKYISSTITGGAGQTKNQNRERKPKKTTKDVVGAGVYLEIEECITKAAEYRLIRNELLKKRGGRYIFSGTRQELLEHLRDIKEFEGKLKRTDNVYRQAISEFAACGKYKRSKKSAKTK